MARAVRAASFTKQTINAENPLLSATLIGGERVQFVLSPTSATGHTFSIRKQFIRRFDLDDYENAGAFRFTKVTGDDYLDDVDIELSRLLRAGKTRAFLELAAANHRSMLISGGTSTGKTTFLNTMLTAIPNHERFILMQDTGELEQRQENVVSLLVSKGGQGEARVTMGDLLATALRLRPDCRPDADLQDRERNKAQHRTLEAQKSIKLRPPQDKDKDRDRSR